MNGLHYRISKEPNKLYYTYGNFQIHSKEYKRQQDIWSMHVTKLIDNYVLVESITDVIVIQSEGKDVYDIYFFPTTNSSARLMEASTSSWETCLRAK